MILLPLIAALVIVLVYFRLFANPIVIVIIFVAYVAVSLRNRRRFGRRQEDSNRNRRSVDQRRCDVEVRTLNQDAILREPSRGRP
jgi:membrane protein implicated in regulation of membrane protease activity